MLDKVVAILRVVAEGPRSFRALQDRLDISRATLHRLAQGMVTVDLLRKNEDDDYILSPSLIGLGRAAADEFPLTTVARPIMRELQRETGESVQLFVVDGQERLCVAAVDSDHELRTIVPLGARLPLELGSAGRVLAGVAERHGWLASVAEREPGVASVSAPIWDGYTLLAAISISGPVERVTRRPGTLFGDRVCAAARAIEAALAGRA